MTEPQSGVVLQGVDPPAEFCGMVQEIEELGFSHLWLTDSSLHARNCYAYLTLAAGSSSRLLLGTAVTNPATRHPAITAAAAATVDEISGGRLILGIGAGDRPLLALGLRPSSLATLEAAIDGIRRLWRGEEVGLRAGTFELNSAHLRFQARPDIPVFLSASGPKTLELAGRIADGVILLVGLFPEALEWAIAQVVKGAQAADRPRPQIAVFAYGSIGGGEALNARARDAWFEADLRAATAAALQDLADRAQRIITAAAGAGLAVKVTELGRRPAGSVAHSSPLARAAADALGRAGIGCEFGAASTDANAAYEAGIPAVALGVTRGEGEHTPAEWIETTPVAAGLAVLADTVRQFREEQG